MTRAGQSKEGETVFLFFFFLREDCEFTGSVTEIGMGWGVSLGCSRTTQIPPSTHTHTPTHTTHPYLHLSSPPFLPLLSPFLSLPLLGRGMEQKVACNYILIFGWYLLCYRAVSCQGHTNTHRHTHTHTHTPPLILSRSLHIKSGCRVMCLCEFAA